MVKTSDSHADTSECLHAVVLTVQAAVLDLHGGGMSTKQSWPPIITCDAVHPSPLPFPSRCGRVPPLSPPQRTQQIPAG